MEGPFPSGSIDCDVCQLLANISQLARLDDWRVSKHDNRMDGMPKDSGWKGSEHFFFFTKHLLKTHAFSNEICRFPINCFLNQSSERVCFVHINASSYSVHSISPSVFRANITLYMFSFWKNRGVDGASLVCCSHMPIAWFSMVFMGKANLYESSSRNLGHYITNSPEEIQQLYPNDLPVVPWSSHSIVHLSRHFSTTSQVSFTGHHLGLHSNHLVHLQRFDTLAPLHRFRRNHQSCSEPWWSPCELVSCEKFCIHTLDYIMLHYITLRYITLLYGTLRYIKLQYSTLHYITLRYVPLHYIHYLPTYLHTYINYIHYINCLNYIHYMHYIHYIHTYLHADIHTYILTDLHTYIFACLHTYILTHLHTYVLTFHSIALQYIALHCITLHYITYVRSFVRSFITLTFSYTHMYIYTYIYIHMYIYI